MPSLRCSLRAVLKKPFSSQIKPLHHHRSTVYHQFSQSIYTPSGIFFQPGRAITRHKLFPEVGASLTSSIKPHHIDMAALYHESQEQTQYTYKPLPGNESIRLLVIEPGELEDKINCALIQAHLPADLNQDSPKYDALSYTWGSKFKTKEITVDGFLFPVTENLFTAIRRLRFPEQPRTLWADAICFNQDDVPERTSQVRKMDHIYKSSQKVMVWLGEEDETTEIAFKNMRWFDEETWALASLPLPKTRDDNPQFFDALFPSADSLVQWNPIISILSRPWFSRGWVIQEVSVAPEVYLVCGQWICPWTILSSMIKYLTRNNIGNFLAGRQTQARLMDHLRYSWQISDEEDPMCTLFFHLVRTPQFSCEKPQDRVFSLMGLVPNRERLSFTVDYSMPCEELYTRIAKDTLQTKYAFWLLAQGPHEAPSTLKLPSWVPDWSLGLEGSAGHSFFHFGFKAAGDTEQNMSVSDKGDILTLNGVLFDTIRSVTGLNWILPGMDRSAEGMLAAMGNEVEYLNEFERLAKTTMPYATGENLSQVLSRAAVGNYHFSNSDSTGDEPYLTCWINLRKAHGYAEQMRNGTLDPATLDSMMEDSMMFTFLEYEKIMSTVVGRRRVGTTGKGYLGWFPQTAKVGDVICIPCGSPVPFLLRKEGRYYKVLGECYVHGIMQGEALKGDYVVQDFSIE